jgi:hypothetical protein
LTVRAHAIGLGAVVAGEGMGLTRGGRESVRERAGERSAVLTGGATRQRGIGWQREGEREERACVGRR